MKGTLLTLRNWVLTGLSLVILFGVGHGTAMLPSRQMNPGQPMADMTNHCQSACPTSLTDEGKTSPLKEEDGEPDPLPFTAVKLSTLSTAAYTVFFAAMALAYLTRRPPDRLAAYGLRRI